MVGGAAVTFKGTHAEGDMRAGSACTKLSVFKKKKARSDPAGARFHFAVNSPYRRWEGGGVINHVQKNNNKKIKDNTGSKV